MGELGRKHGISKYNPERYRGSKQTGFNQISPKQRHRVDMKPALFLVATNGACLTRQGTDVTLCTIAKLEAQWRIGRELRGAKLRRCNVSQRNPAIGMRAQVKKSQSDVGSDRVFFSSVALFKTLSKAQLLHRSEVQV